MEQTILNNDQELTPIIQRLTSSFPDDYKYKIKRRLLEKKDWTPHQFDLYFQELKRFLY